MLIQIIIFMSYQQIDLYFIAYENEHILSNVHLVKYKSQNCMNFIKMHILLLIVDENQHRSIT